MDVVGQNSYMYSDLSYHQLIIRSIPFCLIICGTVEVSSTNLSKIGYWPHRMLLFSSFSSLFMYHIPVLGLFSRFLLCNYSIWSSLEIHGRCRVKTPQRGIPRGSPSPTVALLAHWLSLNCYKRLEEVNQDQVVPVDSLLKHTYIWYITR